VKKRKRKREERGRKRGEKRGGEEKKVYLCRFGVL